MTEENIYFYTLNVAQGDSHVIHFPGCSAAIVIDPGNSDLINELLHKRLQIKSLPLILISHGDWDHMAGINKLIQSCLHEKRGRSIKPGYIFLNSEGMAKSSDKTKIGKLFIRLENLVTKHQLKLKCIFAEEETSELLNAVLNRYGIDGRILYPEYFRMIKVHRKKQWNLASVLMLLTFRNKKILYSGDLPYEGWKQVDKEVDLKSNVFKVPHHGGKISSSPRKDMEKILERVDPNFALVSVGSDNRYKHPLPEVIEAIVTHPSKPHLFCTQMTDRCSKSREQKKEKVNEFYKTKFKEKQEYNTLKLGSDRGTICAGTIRVTFNGNSNKISTFPSPLHHYQMLKTFFSDDVLLCRSGL